MAFHNPDPKMRELEQRNAQLRAAFFAKVFRGAWRGLRRGVRWLARVRPGCREAACWRR
ncbi:hypothetical protein [Halomonas denitrificans]|uniref:hypothetical protein n=1 Tax=Halomonas denitrificans TaxID=370769 RepID=UPI0013002298|nr:hypothetical protein [Halomonas denitrificans]